MNCLKQVRFQNLKNGGMSNKVKERKDEYERYWK